MTLRASCRIASLFLCLLVLGACSGNIAEPVQDPAPGAEPDQAGSPVWAHESSDLDADPAVRYGQLENGMRYVILANDTPTQTAAVRMRIDAGSTAEADDQRGLAHFLEHMTFNGSENVPEGEMVKILERFGLAFGPDTNAFTSFDQTQYQLDLPNVNEELIDTALFLMRETAGNLLLDANAIDRERGIIKSEERARNSYNLRRIINYVGFLAPDMIYKDRLPIGDLEIIANAPRERFVDFYSRFYTPERTTLIMVGDVELDALEAKIVDEFSDWKQSSVPGEEPQLGSLDINRSSEAGFFYDPDVPTFIAIGAPRAATDPPDTAAQRQQDLVRGIGNGVVTRRFTKLAREEGAPMLNGNSSYREFIGGLELAAINLTATPETWREALALGEQELRRALQHGFTQAEINEQIANIRSGLENAAEQAGTRQSTSLAASIANTVHGDLVFTTPASNLERFNAFAPQITPALVNQAFIAQWDGAAPLLHVSNNVEIENPEAVVMAAWKASGQVAVAPPEDASSLEFAYTDFGPPGTVVADSRIEDLNIRTVAFDNNVKLSIKTTDFEEGVARVALRVGGGQLELPTNADGLNVLMGNFFAQGGLEAHSLDELQSIFAGKTVNIGLGMGDDYFGSVMRTSPADLELQLQIWAAFVTHPGFRPEGEAQWRQVVGVFYPTLDAQPSGIVTRDVSRILRNGDTRFGFGTLEEMSSRTYGELRPAIARAFSEGAIEIAVVGDVDEDTVVESVARTFGALPERLADPLAFDAQRQVKFQQDLTPRTLNHAGPANQALALVYWPTTDDSNLKLSATLNTLRAALRLKLSDTLRETLGATYSPTAGSSMSPVYPGYGLLSAISEVEPQSVDTVFQAVVDIASSLGQENGISEDDLARALTPIVEQLDEQFENNAYWLAVLTTAQTRPERLNRARNLRATYEALTTADLIAAAKKYMTPASALKIRIVSDSAAQ